MRGSTGALLLLALTVLESPVTHGQSPQTQAPPTFRARVDLTQIDVSVTDAATRRPVHGLTLDDFELFEDGRIQKIEAFAEVNVPDAEEGAPWMRDVASDVRGNSAEDGRVLIFLLDDANTPSGLETPALVAAVKRIAGAVIDRMGPHDVGAVIFTWDNKRYAQDFTTDRARLRAAVDRFSPKRFDVPYDWFRVSLGVTGSLLKFLAESPGRRKALIYVSASTLGRPSLDNVSVTGLRMLNVFQEGLRSGVTVYGISPAGLKSLGSEGDPLSLGVSADPSASVGADAGRSGRPASPLAARPGTLAAETGGFLINSPAQFTEGVTQILRETGSYYLLGYKSSAEPAEKKAWQQIDGYRSIEIRVTKEGLIVRGRAGYVPPRPVKPPKRPPSPLSEALAGILPKSDLSLRAAVAPFAVAGRDDGAVVMVLEVEEPAPTDRVAERIRMQAQAFTVRGDSRGITARSLDATLGGGRTSDVRLEVLSELRLKPGRYEIRLAATSDRLATDGSVYIDVTVPDFAKDPLSLSGLVLVLNPEVAGVPAIPLASRLPFTPTTKRTFERVDRVGAFLRVYQGGKKALARVDVTVRVIDNQDRAVMERTEALDAPRFGAARAADFRLDLPLATLAAGPHLLRIDAAIGHVTTRRELRFSVK